jgi:hypothetical protein
LNILYHFCTLVEGELREALNPKDLNKKAGHHAGLLLGATSAEGSSSKVKAVVPGRRL